MIQGAILALKERNGSRYAILSFGRVLFMNLLTDLPPVYSRAALKKYVQANNKAVESGAKFDSQFNRAVKSGVDQGIFAQPKGKSIVYFLWRSRVLSMCALPKDRRDVRHMLDITLSCSC